MTTATATAEYPYADDSIFDTDEVQTAIVSVTPDIAVRWLARNTNNRKISPEYVEKHRSDILAGRWHFTGDAFRFDKDGTLLDGQHRLTALSQCPAGTVISALVITGLPTEAQSFMDLGKKRSAGDQLHLIGIKNSTYIASVIRVAIIFDEGMLFRNHNASLVSEARVMEYVEENPEEVQFLQANYSAINSILAPNSALGAFVLIARRQHPADAVEFLHQLHSLAGLETGDAVLTLDRRLRSIRSQQLRYSQRDYLALFFQAFNAFVDGRKISRFLRPSGGWNASSFPTLVSA